MLQAMHRFIRTRWPSLHHDLQAATVHSISPQVAMSAITVDTMNTSTLILKLIRSTTIRIDKLSEYACAGTLQ